MSLSINYGYSPGVAISLFVGLVIGLIIAVMFAAKIISVILDHVHDARMRRYLNRRSSAVRAMGPGEGFGDWDRSSGWESGGIFDHAAGHDRDCNRGWDHEPGGFMDQSLGHSSDRCNDSRDSFGYGRYS